MQDLQIIKRTFQEIGFLVLNELITAKISPLSVLLLLFCDSNF